MRTIRDDLQSGNLRRIYVLTGTEDYLRRVYLSRLSRALLPEDDTMNRTVFEGNKADPMEVLEAAVTLPFLAERRLIIIRDSGWLKSSCALADHLDEIPETTYFLFSEKECDKRNRLYKYAEENGHIATFEPLQEKDAAAFAANMLKRLGFAISDADAKLLADIADNDLHSIANETDKLAAYCYGRNEVTRDDILTLSSAVTQAQMFKMVDAIVAKNRRAAVALYRDLLTAQTPPAVILYNLTNSFYQFSLVLRLLRKGLSSFDIAQQLKMSSFVVGKYVKAARGASIDAVFESDVIAASNAVAYYRTYWPRYALTPLWGAVNFYKNGDYHGRVDCADYPTVRAYNSISDDSFHFGAVATLYGAPVRIAKLSNFLVSYVTAALNVNEMFAEISRTAGTEDDESAAMSWEAGALLATNGLFSAVVPQMATNMFLSSDGKVTTLWPNPHPTDNHLDSDLISNFDENFCSPIFIEESKARSGE